MSNVCAIELAVIFAVACLACLMAWELDYSLFVSTFAAAAGFAAFEAARSA
jgi:hypothetical protein